MGNWWCCPEETITNQCKYCQRSILINGLCVDHYNAKSTYQYRESNTAIKSDKPTTDITSYNPYLALYYTDNCHSGHQRNQPSDNTSHHHHHHHHPHHPDHHHDATHTSSDDCSHHDSSS